MCSNHVASGDNCLTRWVMILSRLNTLRLDRLAACDCQHVIACFTTDSLSVIRLLKTSPTTPEESGILDISFLVCLSCVRFRWIWHKCLQLCHVHTLHVIASACEAGFRRAFVESVLCDTFAYDSVTATITNIYGNVGIGTKRIRHS